MNILRQTVLRVTLTSEEKGTLRRAVEIMEKLFDIFEEPDDADAANTMRNYLEAEYTEIYYDQQEEEEV